MPRGRRIPKAILHDTKMNKYVTGAYSLTTGIKQREYKIQIAESDNLQTIDVISLIAMKYQHEESKIFLEAPPFIVINPQKIEEE